MRFQPSRQAACGEAGRRARFRSWWTDVRGGSSPLMPTMERPILEEKEGVLEMFTIYDHPSDFPDHFVLRRWVITSPGQAHPSLAAKFFDTIEEAREAVPPGLIRTERTENDDPTIVETWI